MKSVDILEKRINASPPDLLRKISDALGVEGKAEIVKLVKADREAQRLVSKIFKGLASSTPSEPVLDVPAQPRVSGGGAAGVEF